MSGVPHFFTFAAALLILSNCASSFRNRDIPPLPKELPADLQAKFMVVEKMSPTTSQTPAPSPSSATAILTKKKFVKANRLAKIKAIKAPPPFSYPDRRTKINSTWVGEQQSLEITYLGIKAGEFTLDVLPMKEIAGRTVYDLRAHAVSSSMLNLFFRLDDTIESFWDYETLYSHRFHMILDQTKQKRDALELYDAETKKDYYWNRRNHVDSGYTETRELLDMEQPFSQDSLTALYFLRTLPLEDGKVYTFPVISEGKPWEAVVTVVRREMMDTPLGRKMCVVVRTQTRYNGVMKQEKGDSFFWLTDDDRRFLVRLEAQVKVGAIGARLKHVELGAKPNVE